MAIKSGKVTVEKSLSYAYASKVITDADVTTSSIIMVCPAERKSKTDIRGQPEFYAVPATGSFTIYSEEKELFDNTDVFYFIDTDGTGSATAGLLDLQGGLDASSNPNYPVAEAGDVYIITVAGKVGGASGKNVEAGDFLIASADNAGGTEAAVGSSWYVWQKNVEAASESLAGVVELATQGETDTGTDDVRAITPLKLASSALATQVGTNTTNIATNAGDITTLQSDVATNASNISSNAAAIAVNTSDISNHTTNTSNPHTTTLEQARTAGATFSAPFGFGTPETVSVSSGGSTAASVATVLTLIDAGAGGGTVTLGSGSYAGQLKCFVLSGYVDASALITGTFVGFGGSIELSNPGYGSTLMWTGSAWAFLGVGFSF